MPIHDQSYRRYGGGKATPGHAWLVIASAGIRTMLRKRAFLGVLLFGITFALNTQPVIAFGGWIALTLALFFGPSLAARGFTVAGRAVAKLLVRKSTCTTPIRS